MAAAPGRFALPRSRRVKQGRDFRRAKLEWVRVAQGCLIMNWFPLPPGSLSRLGNAPIRSRLRRLLREAFRLHQHELNQPADVILIARPSARGRPFETVARDFLAALQRAGLGRTSGRTPEAGLP